jgi:hypothetical protein
MRGHVFLKLPKYCVGLKPGVLWVRCPDCGKPHQEYFGPADRDERNAEIAFLRRELQVAASILFGRHASRPVRAVAGGFSRQRHGSLRGGSSSTPHRGHLPSEGRVDAGRLPR